MDKADLRSSDSDEARAPPPGSEKHFEGEAPVAIVGIPDPDEGLSEEERKRIVSED